MKGSAAARRQRAANSADGKKKRQKYNADRKFRKDQRTLEQIGAQIEPAPDDQENDDGVQIEPAPDDQGVPPNPADDQGVVASDIAETLIVPVCGNHVSHCRPARNAHSI